MREFYERFYAIVPSSPVHALFCERAFGLDLGQHGFADVTQLDALVEATDMHAGQQVLDMGCGDGRIAEYLSDRTGAHVTGLDYIPEAIRLARERTADKAGRLAFVVGDLNALDLPARHFDVILSIDTIYFSQDYARTIGQLAASLRPLAARRTVQLLVRIMPGNGSIGVGGIMPSLPAPHSQTAIRQVAVSTESLAVRTHLTDYGCCVVS